MTQNFRISEVTVPASTIDLTTLDNAKADLGDTGTESDVFLSRLITQSSRAIQTYCNRVFALQGYAETQYPERDNRPYFLPNSRGAIGMSQAPLVKVTSVTEGGTALTVTSDYIVDFPKGLLYRLDQSGNPWLWPSWPVVITYTAGWRLPGQKDTMPPSGAQTLPEDIEHAVIRLVSTAVYARKRDPLLREEEVAGVGRRAYWVAGVSSATGRQVANFPPDVADLVERYRLPAMA